MVLGSQYNNSLQEEENTWEESNNKNRVQNFYYKFVLGFLCSKGKIACSVSDCID